MTIRKVEKTEAREENLDTSALPLRVREMSERSIAGFHVNWISGGNNEQGDDRVEFELNCGAGVGNPGMYLVVRHNGQTYRGTVDIREVTVAWVDHAVRLIDERLDAQRQEDAQ